VSVFKLMRQTANKNNTIRKLSNGLLIKIL